MNMKKSKIVSILLTFLLLTSITTGCNQSTGGTVSDTTAASTTTDITAGVKETATVQETEPVSSAIVITDMTGRKITLDAPADKIVALKSDYVMV